MLRFLFFILVLIIFFIAIFDVLLPFFKWTKKIFKKLFKLFKKIFIKIKNKVSNKIKKVKAEKFKNSHEGILKDWEEKKYK